MKVTQIYNSANNINYLKELSEKLDILKNERISELEGILEQLEENSK